MIIKKIKVITEIIKPKKSAPVGITNFRLPYRSYLFEGLINSTISKVILKTKKLKNSAKTMPTI